MQWYENAIDRLEIGKSYSRREVVRALQSERSDLRNSSYNWAISALLRNGILTRKGYDKYSLSEEGEPAEYKAIYSDEALDLILTVNKEYPDIKFTVFETILMNEFLNHLIAQNTIFIQVEKESSIFVFRFLQEMGYRNLMYNPSKKDYVLYWSKNSIVINDLISEAPLRADEPHSIMLEKMLVDMCADKLISDTYSKAELPKIIRQAENHYRLDKTRMLRYARRRNREAEMKKYLEGNSTDCRA